MLQALERVELSRLVCLSGAPVPEYAMEPLADYLDMLCSWNKGMNLVGLHSWQDVLTRLVLDSFYLARFLERLAMPAAPVCWDLGSGAGLPGIPLRMAWIRGAYYMVEAREKRALFISHMLARLRLPQTYVFRGRAEQFFQEQPRAADCIVSRAFMPWRQLLDFTAEHVQPGGFVIILANDAAPEQPPVSWRVALQESYGADGSMRYFWALQYDGTQQAAVQ